MLLRILSYPKSIIGGLSCIIWTLLWSIFTIVSTPFLEKHRELGNFITYYWSRGLLFFLNVKVKVIGRENLTDENGIYIFNHSSHFDIPVVFVALKGRTARFGAKTELFKIPFFGRAMKNLGVLEIHRGQRDRVIQLYKESLKNLDKGMNYILAPEGTRQSNGKLGKFKSGPFIMAIAGQCPLKPLAITGTRQIMPKHSIFPSWGIWRSDVVVKILPPISGRSYNLESRDQLSEVARRSLQEGLV